MSEDKKQPDEPIPGPSQVGPKYIWEPDRETPGSFSLTFVRTFSDAVRKPVHWIRENLIEPNRGPKYYWYHRKFNRALPVDECYMDDYACIYEADIEFKRNKLVDSFTLELLRYRRDSCHFWNITTKNQFFPSDKCKDLDDTYDREEMNYFIKYGDLHYDASVIHAYNKQKHRMIMERRRALRKEKGELPEHQS